MLRWLGFFVFGAVVGSLLDGIHTHSGMTEYPDPWLWMMAWHTPVIFGLANVAIANTHLQLDRAAPRPRPSATDVFVALAFFIATYFASGYLPLGNGAKAITMAAAGLAAWLAFDRSWQGALLALITATAGPLVEVGLSHAGLFRHLHPDIWGVPYWLSGLYATASIAIGNLARRYMALSASGGAPPALARG